MNIISEIIVVDSGLTDDTVQISRDMSTSIYRFDWRNDFSKIKTMPY
jgi:glycosyltransferase involved in cell wall biosynthesis